MRWWCVVVVVVAMMIPGSAGAQSSFVEVLIPLPDEVALAGDLYVPEGGGSWPTLLIMTPYGKQLFRPDQRGLPFGTDDYAWLVVDWRGYGASGGEPLGSNGEDGSAVVEWIAAQSWSDGHVGMWGSSALGVIQSHTAVEQAKLADPHLDACVPQFADFRRDYEQYFPGGVLKWEYSLFHAFMGYIDWDLWLDHSSHDPFWTLIEAAGDLAGDIETPMLLVAGWYDLDTREVLWGWDQLTNHSDASHRNDHRFLIGPWTHADENDLTQGELEYPRAVGTAHDAALAFFDHWVRGIEPAEPTPRVRWYEMGAERWHDAESWPPELPTLRTWFLHPDRSLSTEASGIGSLTYGVDPDDPSPTVGGPRTSILEVLEGPADLRFEVENRSDALVLTSEPLERSLTIAGAPEVRLWLSTDGLDTDVMVRLTDVHPDGRSMFVVDGARRARFRDGFDTEVLMNPGVPAEIPVVLQPTAITVQAGHRLRLVITSTNHPRFHINPNDGGDPYDPDAVPRVATNTVFTGPDHPSRLILPTIDTGWAFGDGFETGDGIAWSLVVGDR
jgi:predicted acyl esterase